MSEHLSCLKAALADRYAVERTLGRGGTATVYLVRDLKHDRLVALKLLRPEFAAAIGPERFLREIRVTARLQHPHILPLLDSGTLEDTPGLPRPYYVMPYIEGESLRGRLVRERQLPVGEAVRIALDVAAALDYAHSQGVVHRDIKPENILLADDHPILADFGVASAVSHSDGERLTETGLALGTPQYMSPEQAAGDPTVNARTDVYALGCVLYEMLAGDPPFTGSNVQAVLARHRAGSVPRLRPVRRTVPEKLERVITRALAKTPADRFATTEEFAAALSESMRPPSLPHGGSTDTRWRRAATLIAALGAGAAAVSFWQHRSGPSVSPSASLIAVLPFKPSGADTALSRLGRDLVFTLTAELDGLGDIRMVDAHTVLAQAGQSGLSSLREGAALARRLGAGSSVHGSLVREGASVRLDFALLATDTTAPPLARGSVTGAPDSIATLTDSAARVLLGEIWARGSAPTPSLDVALRTRSVPALRAFLTGEGEMAGGQWDSAATSYGRAIQEDPAFWLAYARYVYARNWALADAPDSVMSALARHRFELPDRERLTTEAILLWAKDSTAASLERAREVSERYPDSWFGWLIYGDELSHDGPLLGHPRAEARAALERAVGLNPNLIPGWEHLTLLALLDRDTLLVRRSLGELQRLRAGPVLTADRIANRPLRFRFLHALERGDTASVWARFDSIARDPAPAVAPVGTFYDPFRYGLFDAQLRVSEKALKVWSSPGRQATHLRLIAFSWAARGAWDSALVAMDRWVASGTDSTAALRSYGVAVVGAWLGALDPRETAARRSAAVAAARSDRSRHAEVAWLDGLAAYAQRDRHALEQARAELRQWEGSASTAPARSLEAFAQALGGATREAGETMARLEWQEAAVGSSGFASHPYAIAVDRLAAARWLDASGDTDQAARLLTWVDGPFLIHPSTTCSVILTGLVDLERGRIEERRGHVELARRSYREFVARYDRPVPSQRHLVSEAKAALARLSTTSRPTAAVSRR